METTSTSLFTTSAPPNQIQQRLQSAATNCNVMFQATSEDRFMMRCKHLCQAHPRNISVPILHGKIFKNVDGSSSVQVTFQPTKAVYLFLFSACAFFIFAGVVGTMVLHKKQTMSAAIIAVVCLLFWYRSGGLILCEKERQYMTNIVQTAISNPS